MNINEPMKKKRFLEVNAPNRANKLIGGNSSGILNWNDIAYPQLYELYKTMRSNFWTPEEISTLDDIKTWKILSENERQTFLSIIGLLSILDSIQPNYITSIKEYFSDNSVQAILDQIAQQEVIHNQSYSYILASVEKLEVQNRAFEMARTEKEIHERNKFIVNIYEDFRENPTPWNLCRSLVASINLEGINFYSAFAFFYNLSRNNKMLATSQMISYINKDELAHSYAISLILKLILKENPEIDEDGKFEKETKRIFKEATELEIDWAKYVLKGINDIDLAEMEDYIKYRANKCLSMLNYTPLYEGVNENSMPWIRVYSDENFNSTKTDFFEGKSRQYSKTTDANGFDEL